MKNPNWQFYNLPTHQDIPGILLDWLLHGGSFMQRLKDYGSPSHVRVLSQRWQLPMSDERLWLDLDLRRYALVREVLIGNKDTVWMFARTVFPLETLTGAQRQLAYLKGRALGSVLFKQHDVNRSAFALAAFEPGMITYDRINQHVAVDSDMLWGRRSLFTINQKSLLLTEIFFPSILQLSKAS